MTVPITSDLEGYRAFWQAAVTIILVLETLQWAVVAALLATIVFYVRRGR